MIVTRLTGGLGNQMFQYAFGRRLALKHGTDLTLDLRAFSDPRWNNPRRTYDLGIFNINENFASDDEVNKLANRTRFEFADRVLNRLFGVKRTHVREPHFHFSKEAYHSPDNVYLSGYWQSEKYFSDVEDQIRADFTFRDRMHPGAESVFERIKGEESVCVHVRRTDYITNPTNALYGSEYYRAAEEVVRERAITPAYFVFSDDIEWCKNNLRFRGETHFVSEDFGPWKARDDLRLMSACKHFIIANSSFSWWAAWLNPVAGKTVVAPDRWFRDKSLNTRDLIPAGWIRI
jgi:hypothetical protein